MTTLLDRADQRASVTPAQWLRDTTAATRVSFTWMGVRKTLTPAQKGQAAESFGAEADFLSARKKLLDTKHPAFKEVTAVRGKVGSFWKSLTLPFPEPGIRLIRQHEVQRFNEQMTAYRMELGDAVARLEEHFSELKAAARRRLGDLFDASDYPASLRGLFAVDWDYPAIEAPDYLLQLNPAIYEQERSRIAARFQEAVLLAEQAFISEFAKLIEHLCERLGDGGDGQRKVFRDSAVDNLADFFQRFRQLNVGSNAELDALVDRARQIVRGVEPQALRDNAGLRQHVASQLTGVQAVIDGMLVNQPRRRIIRSQTSTTGDHHEPRD
ncbi:MAG: hypothetical protein FJ271_31800 [Planctomycetes bacterium]|nr:hypothetical protein [Planctomycetota bacterium]